MIVFSRLMLFIIIILGSAHVNLQAYPLTALDWSAFPTSGGSSYNETHALSGPITPTLTFDLTSSGALSSTGPVSFAGLTMEAGFLTNPNPVIGMGTRNVNNSPLAYTVTITGSAVLRPGDAIYFGDFLYKSVSDFTYIDNIVACDGATCGLVVNTTLAPSNANMSALTRDLIYDAAAGTITPVTGGGASQTGALFLLNTGPFTIDSFSYRVNPTQEAGGAGELLLQGIAATNSVLIPEPSTYLILGSMVAFSLVMITRKQKRA